MPISVVFDPPLPSDSPSTFNTKAFTLLGDLNDWSTQANALPGEVATNLSALLAAPPAIGGTTPAAGSFTTLSASGNVNAGLGLTGANNGRVVINGGASSSFGAQLLFNRDGVNTSQIGQESGIIGGTSNDLAIYPGAANLNLYGGGTKTAVVSSSGLAVTGALSSSGAATMSGTLNVKSTAFGLAGFGAGSGYAATDTTVRLVSYFGSSDAPAPGVSPSGLYIAYTGAASVANRRTDLNTYTYGSGAQGVLGLNNGAVVIDNAGAVTISGSVSTGTLTTTGTLGYGTGAGGTVTQATSKSTAVTLNKPSGQITMNNEALAAGASVLFALNNTFFATTDTVVLTGQSWSIFYRIETANSATEQIGIRVTNTESVSRSDPLAFSFAIVKGATA